MVHTWLHNHRKLWSTGGAVALLGGAGLFSLWSHSGVDRIWAAANEAPPAAVAQANDLSAAFRYASEQVVPSVVTIRNIRDEEVASSGAPGMQQGIPDELSPLLKRFFGDEMPQLQTPSPRHFRQEGTGSGVIIDESGIILTNNHVAGGGGKVLVRLHDGREFTATDVKTDPKTDLAIVRIEGAGKLPAAVMGDSDKLQIGDWVLAVGSPFGLDDTVTAGIISAKSRGMGITEREDFLQTDAAINPGNSGGPLVNLQGEVVGINTAISTRGGGNDGIGFAVPVNLARWVSHQLVESGTVERAFLGIGIQQVSNDLSKQFGLETVRGALVTEVRPDTAAAKAGLQVGDVVVEFDGHPVLDPRGLQNIVERAVLSDTHRLAVVRNGERVVVDVQLQTMPQTVAASHPGSGSAQKSEFDQLGLQVADLTTDVAEQLGLAKTTSGVVITAVTAGSAASNLGLKEGMVISQVGKTAIKNVDDFRTAMKDANLNSGLLLLVQTPEGSQFLVLKSE
ncbi:MAG: Do family serine endopeptidase [Planctomycetaceae bacterium]|nr:Do family serine endopeptidase [Planctomycetaceae bacterium]